MLIDLDRDDLICLVKGFELSYGQMEHPMSKANGKFSGSHDRWDWNYNAFRNCTEENLYKYFLYLKGTKE